MIDPQTTANATSYPQVVFGIDIIASKKFGSTPIDLVVSGPNEGLNTGPFVFTLSGTVGATYVSVERGVRVCIYTPVDDVDHDC